MQIVDVISSQKFEYTYPFMNSVYQIRRFMPGDLIKHKCLKRPKNECGLYDQSNAALNQYVNLNIR